MPFPLISVSFSKDLPDEDLLDNLGLPDMDFMDLKGVNDRICSKDNCHIF